jgi:hypothetical protein
VADSFEDGTLSSGGIPAYHNLWNLEDMIDIILPHFIDDIQ